MSSIASPLSTAPAVSIPEISLFRLYALRAVYLMLFAGLGVTVWPSMIHHAHPWTLWQGVGKSMLTAISLLAALGIRYPLKMLPLLFYELTWKIVWLIAVALPLSLGHNVDADTAETMQECLYAIVIPIVIPWRYVFAQYVRQPADRWK